MKPIDDVKLGGHENSKTIGEAQRYISSPLDGQEIGSVIAIAHGSLRLIRALVEEREAKLVYARTTKSGSWGNYMAKRKRVEELMG